MADTDLKAPSADATKSWWTTLPGILTALAGVVTAISGLLAVLAQQGVIGGKSAVGGSHGAAMANPAPSTEATAAAPKTLPSSQAAPAAPGPATHTPATTAPDVADLRATGFKGAVVTLVDGAKVRVAPGLKEYIQGQRIKLETGQYVDFERMQAFEVLRFSQDDQRGEVAITLTNGQSVRGNIVEAIELRGRNDLGDFAQQLKAVKRVDFLR
jgi:hypothetical protein